MKTLTAGLLLAASPALAQPRALPGAPLPIAAQYGAAAHTAGVSVAKTQYAIIHALTGWESPNLAGYSDFASYKMADQVLLRQIEERAGLRIEVSPLSAAERAVLWEKARHVRAAHRYGRDSAKATPMRAIPEAEMQRRHAAIIAQFADRVKLVPSGSGPAGARVEEPPQGTGGLPFTEESYSQQNRRFAALRLATEQLAAAAGETEFKAALDRWNAAAAPFGKGRRVEWRPGQDARAALDRALAYEHDEGRELSRMGAYLGHASVYDALGRIKATGAFFDGSRSAAPSPMRPAPFPNAVNPEGRVPESAGQSVAPLKSEVPDPGEEKEEKGKKPGLFGMLGSLLGQFFTGLLRTAMRVGAAVLKSAGLIAKALFS